jgi:uncharacterized iron-regulated membrane protein
VNLWQRWATYPQGLWLRKAIFQVHLWSGIAIGLYVTFVCITGSAVVFNPEVAKKFTTRPPILSGSGEHLNEDQLREAAQKAYPGYEVSQVFTARNPDQAPEIWLTQGKTTRQRFFHPYTGEDLGESVPFQIHVMAWLLEAHINLLYGENGRIVNGVGSIILTILCITGAIIWWPGSKSWRRSLTVALQSNWRRLNWDLHSAIGFWTFLVVLMFAVSGIYLVFPDPFTAVIDPGALTTEFDSANFTEERFGNEVLRWLARLHFGRFAGWEIKAIWVVLGLVPPVLFVTGALMWWNRVIRKSN